MPRAGYSPFYTRAQQRYRMRQMADAYRSGMSIRGVADTFGVGKSTVHYALKRLGVARRRPVAWRKLSPELVQRMCEAHRREGLNSVELGQRFGVSQSYASRVLRQARLR